MIVMMIQPSEELMKLCEEYKNVTDIKEIEKIRKKIHKEIVKQNEKLKDCPFAH